MDSFQKNKQILQNNDDERIKIAEKEFFEMREQMQRQENARKEECIKAAKLIINEIRDSTSLAYQKISKYQNTRIKLEKEDFTPNTYKLLAYFQNFSQQCLDPKIKEIFNSIPNMEIMIVTSLYDDEDYVFVTK